MIEVSGKTVDGFTVVTGVYKFYETNGMPLDVLFETLRNRKMTPDWLSFMLEAVEANTALDDATVVPNVAYVNTQGAFDPVVLV